MKTYEQVLEAVEIALTKGEYHFCIEFLSQRIDSYPLSTKEGDNLRTIFITALCGINKKEEAKKFCKELLKSHDYKTRENAKYLMEIIDSPEIKKPENWNINFESNPSLKNKSINSLKTKNYKEEKKYINISDKPTGETKPFKKEFTLIIVFILFLLIPLLSGCVKIENTLDLRELESINNYLTVESKYINKFPWQVNFENKIKDIFPNADISIEEYNFSLNNKSLELENAKKILRTIQQTAGELAGLSTDLEFNNTEKNFIFLKKHSYKLDIDLQTLSGIEDLEITFKIINPNKANLISVKNPQLEISKNIIIWNLIPGEINKMEFSFWSWNKLLIGITIISLLIIMAYGLRFYRFKIGTDLPQLPSD